MSLLPSGAIESAGYDINNSLRFRSSASAYLSRSVSTTNRRTYTFSTWIKRGALGLGHIYGASIDGNNEFVIRFNSSDNIQIYNYVSAYNLQLVTTQVFRDPSAWYHVIVAIDTTQATSSNRVKLYINGSEVTAFSTATYPSQNFDTLVNSSTTTYNRISSMQSSSGFYDGYQSEFYFVDGQALTPSSFGETDTTTGVWKPKAYTGTYGTNGFYLKFSDIATTSGSNAGLGKDFSGNTNYWTTNNISVTSGTTYDAMKDSPTLTSDTVSNYATLNYIDTNTASSISAANLNWVDAGGIDREIRGTIGVSSGKYYWETVVTSGNTSHVGVDTLNSTLLVDYLGSTSTSWSIYLGTGNKRNAASNTSYGSSFTTNDIMMCALDMDNGKIWWGKNGTWFASGDPAAGTNAAFTNLSGYTLAFAATPRSSCSVNFGQRPFSYTPPTGFKRLNTYNLPDSTIKKGSQYFNTVLYTGNGSTNAITGVGFSPNFVWVKNRAVAEHNCLYDSVRGVYKQLYSNLTNAEDNATNSLTSFDSDGFTLGNNTTPNTNGNAHVSWNWRGSDSSAVSNTSGSITSTVSVNTTAGFSIVTYAGGGSSGNTVGHGLGVTPSMVIVKNRTNGGHSWAVRHVSLTSTQNLALQNIDGAYTVSSATSNGGIGTLSSTTIGFISGTVGLLNVNASSNNYVAYCWAAIPGFSAFGSYTANASADGPFIYTGFRPRWIMFKRTTSSTNWYVIDTSISPYNASTTGLYPNTSSSESTEGAVDILSNGFKCRASSGAFNYPGNETYIYAAYAENPFKNANAR